MGSLSYFDKKSKDYNSFCLDEEDINPLQNFVAQIKSADSDSVIYVSTYLSLIHISEPTRPY